ncbi:MAG: radical SAM family RiPP maturation amino acid epimerase [Proteobacteria bacterium]|nr:radical SAM family RiPP maturation amino acid epimerase [Pseudomonadota bacterium]MBU1057257.1 radical SAM family RiPP maturation amino acid epimerase [Pseudomonadota bacterium]
MIPVPGCQQWPLVKRLFELWNSDPSFRKTVNEDFDSLSKTYRLCPDSLALAKHLWQDNSFTDQHYSRKAFPQLHDFLQHQQELMALRSHIRQSCDPLPARFSKWRNCQINRCEWQFGTQKNETIIHMPICFELSQGCSLGCHFCGLSAPKLRSVFAYTPQNSQLWQEILQVCRDILGNSSSRASLYWATEPFDNPDYERFCLDFHSILGVFPQTTTALALASITRTKNFFRLSQARGCELNRLSVHTVEDLLSLHSNFTAEELAQVELVLQNQGSLQKKVKAGRLLTSHHPSVEKTTISCTTGFLVNLVEKSVRLISPWPADAEHPSGYKTFAQNHFSTADDFTSLLQQMISTTMQYSFSSQDPVQLTPGIRCLTRKKATLLSSPYQEISLSQLSNLPHLHKMLGTHNAGEIALHYMETEGIDPALTFMTLNSLLRSGIVEAGVQQ